MKKRAKQIIIFILILSSFIFYYYLTEEKPERISISISQVVDGDTVKDSNGNVYRLLGINTPEKNQPFYNEAKENLKNLIEGKEVEVEIHERDKYSRFLGYIYLNGKLINQEQLLSGLANLYYYGEDSNYENMKQAEEIAMHNFSGIWKKSSNFGCLKLLKINYLDEDNEENKEQIILENNCKNLDVIMKDNANHIYNLNIPSGKFSKNFSHIWNDDGDSLFIRDDSGLLLFYRY